MSELFDDISRIVGSPIPRRQAIWLIASGLVSTAITTVSPKRVDAQGCAPSLALQALAPGTIDKTLCSSGPLRVGDANTCLAGFDNPNRCLDDTSLNQNAQPGCCPGGKGSCCKSTSPTCNGTKGCCPTGFFGCCPSDGVARNGTGNCCPKDHTCCGCLHCCRPGFVCTSGPSTAGECSCPTGREVCGSGDMERCCETGQICCMGRCCPAGHICCNGVCCPRGDSTGTTCNSEVGCCTPVNGRVSAVRPGPPTQVDVTLQHAERGIVSISIYKAVNCTVGWPFFFPGTKEPIVCCATKIDQTKPAQVVLQAVIAPNSTSCPADPVITVLEIPERSKRVKQTFTDVPKEESYVMVSNGNPGLKRLYIEVNGERLELLRLKDDDEVTLKIPSMMMRNSNTVTLVGFGKAGGTALVVIADSAPSDTSIDTPIDDVPIDDDLPRKKRREFPSRFPSNIFLRDREMRTGVNMVWGNQVEQ